MQNILTFGKATYIIYIRYIICTSNLQVVNALPDMPILGSSNLAANKDMMSEIWKNGDTII